MGLRTYGHAQEGAARFYLSPPSPRPLQVSVVIPVFNAAPFVEAAVLSALHCPEVAEVIVVEDGSTDGSAATADAMARQDPRVRLLHHPQHANLGASASRNLGMAQARFPFLAFLDADDRYLPDRFHADALVFEQHPDADGCHGAVEASFHDADGERRYRERGLPALTGVRRIVPPEALFDGLCFKKHAFGHIHLDALTLRTSSLPRMDHGFQEQLFLHQDSEFILRAAHYLRLYTGRTDKPVALRGVHGGNRITATVPWGESRMLQFGLLHDWARREGLPPAVVRRFKALSMAGRFRMGHGTLHPMHVLAAACAAPRLWKHHEWRMAAIDAVCGEGSWCARKLNAAGWWVFGR